MPSWLTKGRTVLLQSDMSKGNIASNYRSITYIPLAWRLVTSMLAERPFNSAAFVARKAERMHKKFNVAPKVQRAAFREVKSRKKK